MAPLDDVTSSPPYPVAQESMSIVLRGPFNPVFFSPRWFRDAELIGDVELEEAEISIISQPDASFKMSWLNVSVTLDSLQLYTDDVDEFPRLRDAAVGLIRTLELQPVAALGVNREFHVTVPSIDVMHRIGDTLAPKDPWNDVVDFAVVRSVQMWGARQDDWEGRLNIRVEPSVLFPSAIFVSVNDHFELTTRDVAPTSRDDAYSSSESLGEPTVEKRANASDILTREWTRILDRWARVSGKVLALGRDSSE